jgi:hypothetical protein
MRKSTDDLERDRRNNAKYSIHYQPGLIPYVPNMAFLRAAASPSFAPHLAEEQFFIDGAEYIDSFEDGAIYNDPYDRMTFALV